MAWQTPKTNWGAADVPLPDDFNRIEGNVQELQNTKETPAGAQAKAEAAAGAVQAELDAHLDENTTQVHVNALASEAEAVAGETNNKFMTPLRTKQAIDEALKPLLDDTSGSPGSANLIAGTMQEGFFGEVSSSELITGDALASECGISQGTSQYSTAGWLKFAYKDKILFVAKKPIRHSISWDAINTAKCVYGDSGDKTVVIGGKTYKVTLMRALEPTNNPKTTASAWEGEVNHGSEWNRLMCQIHEEAINGSWDYPNNIESDIGILKHNLGSGNQGMYSDADLNIGSGYGRESWCQEMSTSTSHRLFRGGNSVSHSYHNISSYISSDHGWRPVLELL